MIIQFGCPSLHLWCGLSNSLLLPNMSADARVLLQSVDVTSLIPGLNCCVYFRNQVVMMMCAFPSFIMVPNWLGPGFALCYVYMVHMCARHDVLDAYYSFFSDMDCIAAKARYVHLICLIRQTVVGITTKLISIVTICLCICKVFWKGVSLLSNTLLQAGTRIYFDMNNWYRGMPTRACCIRFILVIFGWHHKSTW